MSRSSQTNFEWNPRPAREEDVPALEVLIPLSVQMLQSDHYTAAQMEAAIGPVFGVDRQLIRDGTYYVIEMDGRILGCGGWSKHRSQYGSDSQRTGEDPELDPKTDAARVRAFFVDPGWARRGVGRSIMVACENAVIAAGFRKAEIVATLTGEGLYAAFGYAVAERFDISLPEGLKLPVVRMTKSLDQ